MISPTGIAQVCNVFAAKVDLFIIIVFVSVCPCDSMCISCASAADWWKSMKQLLPSKMVETEDSVRYSSSEVGRLTGRGAVPRLHAEPAGKNCST